MNRSPLYIAIQQALIEMRGPHVLRLRWYKGHWQPTLTPPVMGMMQRAI